jgi:TonB family protein
MSGTEMKTIGRYQFLRQIGEGSIGTVFEAVEMPSKRTVAAKWIHPEVATFPGLAERIRVHAIGPPRLEHPNIHPLERISCEGGEFVFVMERVRGYRLDQCQGGAEDKIVPEFLRALDGFGYAHRRGFYHADIKAGNILVLPDGSIRIMDFQMSRILGVTPTTAELLGSPEYMSPEQARGEGTDARSDIYSLGLVLCKLVTGKLTLDQAPLKMRAAIARAAHPDREQRYLRVEEFRQALQDLYPGLVPSAETAVVRSVPKATAPTVAVKPEAPAPAPARSWRPAIGVATAAAAIISGLSWLVLPSARDKKANGANATPGRDPRPAAKTGGMLAVSVPKRVPPSTKPSPNGTARIHVAESTQRARLVRSEPPVYPPAALQSQISGLVRLEAMISADGRVESVRTLSGHAVLAEAAAAAVRNWLYTPAVVNSKPVPVSAEIEINFAPQPMGK